MFFVAAIDLKLEEGNIHEAVHILCNQSYPDLPNEENLQILLVKHPVDPHPNGLLNLPDPENTTPIQVTESDVMNAIQS